MAFIATGYLFCAEKVLSQRQKGILTDKPAQPFPAPLMIILFLCRVVEQACQFL
ncbi:hypothetical protein ACAD17_004553 [Enterobacter ludwigii]